MKLKFKDFIDSIFLLVVGILFLVFPSTMINYVGLIIGIYFIIKALIGYFLPHIFPLSRLSAGINLFLGFICLLLWGFFLKFIMLMLGIILLGDGLTKLTGNHFKFKDKKTYLPTVLAVIESLCGLTIFITSLTNAGNTLGILTGVVLVLLSIILFIGNIIKGKSTYEYDEPEIKVETKTDVFDAEIISEKHTHEE